MLHTSGHRAAPGSGWLLSVTALPAVRPGLVVVEVTGDVDTWTVPVLEACLHSQAARRGLQTLVADLSRVSFLGVAGVSVLVRVDRWCRQRGSRMVIRTGGRRTVLRSLRLTGLAHVLAVDPVDDQPLRRKGRGRLDGQFPAGGRRPAEAPSAGAREALAARTGMTCR